MTYLRIVVSFRKFTSLPVAFMGDKSLFFYHLVVEKNNSNDVMTLLYASSSSNYIYLPIKT